MNYLKKHISYIYIFVLAVICIMMFFPNMSSYPFIDTDETKFVSIAKEMLNNSDWINIKLYGENIYNIPPLFFIITNFMCVLMGKINAEAMRLPVSLISTAGILCMYLGLKNILTKTYAAITSLIFATCLGTLIFSRLATNDMISLVIIMTVIILSYNVILKKDSNYTAKLWYGIYILSAFSVLCSGLFGLFIIIPSIIIMHIFSGNLKEIFKPKNLIPGILMFIIVSMPWLAVMFYKHKFIFLKEYMSIYNFIKYIGIKEIGTVLGLFILMFLPWVFSFIWILGRKAKDIYNSVISYFKENSQDKLKEKWKRLKKADKFSSLNTIVFFTTLIFAILYGAKYTYIMLFMLFPASCITGKYWYEYLIKKQHGKSIFFATIIPNLIFIICSLLGLFGHNILNKWIYQGFGNLVIPLIIIFFVIPLISIIAVILKGRIIPFAANIILIVSLSFVLTPQIFNFMSANGGENDLIAFANTAKEEKVKLTAYIPSKKYSLSYYYDKPIDYNNPDDLEGLKTYLTENPNDYVVVEIKDLWNIEEAEIKYMLLDSGTRYCMIQHMPYEEAKQEEQTEAEIVVY